MKALQAYFEGVKATQRPTYIIALDHMDKLKIIAFVGNAGPFKNETNFAAHTVVSRSVQLWGGDHPAGLCHVSVGLKIHDESP